MSWVDSDFGGGATGVVFAKRPAHPPFPPALGAADGAGFGLSVAKDSNLSLPGSFAHSSAAATASPLVFEADVSSQLSSTCVL